MTMRIDIITLFPELCEAVMGESIVGRARKKGAIEVYCHQLREYTYDKHNRVDDTPVSYTHLTLPTILRV